jgi:hypothetical protein
MDLQRVEIRLPAFRPLRFRYCDHAVLVEQPRNRDLGSRKTVPASDALYRWFRSNLIREQPAWSER